MTDRMQDIDILNIEQVINTLELHMGPSSHGMLVDLVKEAKRAREAEKDQENMNTALKKANWAMLKSHEKLEAENAELKKQLDVAKRAAWVEE